MSHFSLLDGLSKPKQILSRIEEIDAPACALTDHGSISGHIQFLQAMKKANKKAILGCELYISNQDATIKDNSNRKMAHMCVLAKNDQGWRDLVQVVSESNKQEFFYHKPRLDLNRFAPFASNGNLLAFSGHIGSHMSNILFTEDGELSLTWKQEGVRLAKKLEDIFGKGNFFLEVQLMDSAYFKKQILIADCIREISKETGIPCVATQDAHYTRQQDAEDQRVLLCSNMNVTMQKASQPGFMMGGFFHSKQYHIPTYEEMKSWHTDEELDNTLLIASKIEDYQKILRSPILPKFPCLGNQEPDEYLRALCREGWSQKIQGKVESGRLEEYRKRVEYELSVLQGAKLSSYFLIVADIINFVKSNGWIAGPGRGSAAGCLVSYLTGITSIDPIPYNLIFERFYNAGRNTEDHISMPDIDMDIPKYAREHVINYIRTKYGEDKVGQMVTFQTIKGKGALKGVMKAYGGMSFDEMNEITKNIIEEHKIADELQKMQEERGHSSIIQWCLENTGNKLKKWCYLDSEDKLHGPLAARFEQAMRLEGTKTAVSKHPAGIIIAPETLGNMCPMVYDKESDHSIAGFEMNDMEAIGGIKFDVLGITALDKAMGIKDDLYIGEVREIQGIKS